MKFEKDDHKGLTFFELMVAVAILAFGITSIYRSFFISLHTARHINYRLQAFQLLQNRAVSIAKVYAVSKEIPLAFAQEAQQITIDGSPVNFLYDVSIKNVGQKEGILELMLEISWREGRYQKKLQQYSIIIPYE